MTEAKHTPLPWTVSDYYEEEAGPAIIGADGYPVAEVEDNSIMEDWPNILGLPKEDHWAQHPGKAYIERPKEEFQANADLIVRAVNNHDALMEALDEGMNVLADIADEENFKGWNDTIATMSKVLAKAKGES